MGKPEGKRPLGRPRRRRVNSIKTDLKELGCDAGDWMDFAQDWDNWQAYIRAVKNPPDFLKVK